MPSYGVNFDDYILQTIRLCRGNWFDPEVCQRFHFDIIDSGLIAYNQNHRWDWLAFSPSTGQSFQVGFELAWQVLEKAPSHTDLVHLIVDAARDAAFELNRHILASFL